MIRIYFEITPCRKSLDANIRLAYVYRTDVPEDLTAAPDTLIVHEKHENVKAKRSTFTSMKAKPGKLDLTLIRDLKKLGLSQNEACNILLACTREAAKCYCDPTENEGVVKFSDNKQVQVTFEIKGRKTLPAGYITTAA